METDLKLLDSFDPSGVIVIWLVKSGLRVFYLFDLFEHIITLLVEIEVGFVCFCLLCLMPCVMAVETDLRLRV